MSSHHDRASPTGDHPLSTFSISRRSQSPRHPMPRLSTDDAAEPRATSSSKTRLFGRKKARQSDADREEGEALLAGSELAEAEESELIEAAVREIYICRILSIDSGRQALTARAVTGSRVIPIPTSPSTCRRVLQGFWN